MSANINADVGQTVDIPNNCPDAIGSIWQVFQLSCMTRGADAIFLLNISNIGDLEKWLFAGDCYILHKF